MNLRALVLMLLVGACATSASSRAFAQLLSPGPLAAAHANLEGDDNCGRCHAAGKGVANGLCTNCHIQIAASKGMHGRAWKGQSCAKCHSDHRGRGFALVRFDPKSFQHAQIWSLGGAHAKAKCGDCHKGGGWQGLSTNCSSCHKDPHAGRFGVCLTCHNESAWSQVKIDKFDHSLARFQLRGAHGSVPCGNCHGSPPRYRGLDFGNCGSCHHDPHRGRFGTTCTNCHSETTFHSIQMKAGAHPGVSLSGGHGKLGCRSCHDRGALTRPSRGGRCSSCHKAVHEAPFGNRCEKCHAQIRWVGIARRIGLAAHDKTPFSLKGKHVSTACSKCHVPSQPAQKRYRELTFDKCKSCHSDRHSGEFGKRQGGECAPCHTESGFSPTTFGVELHASTHFPLMGHHVAVPCSNCHKGQEEKKPRLEWNQAEKKCASCHENPHGNQFAAEMQKHGCAGCHSPIGWDVPNIDHTSWPLTGAHGSARCGRCHTPTDSDRKAGKGASYKNTPRQCEGCHTDVHRGQFRLTKPVKTCGACHSTVRFTIGVFDHAKSTGYTLDGSHRQLPCNRCHSVAQLGNGTKTARWRLGYRRCSDCHADPHGEGGS